MSAVNQKSTMRARLTSPPAEEVVRAITGPKTRYEFASGFYQQMAVHKAHVIMLQEQGILGTAEARALLGALAAIEAEGPQSFAIDSSLEDMYSHIERRVIERVGPDIGGRMHTGRSRNDLHVTMWRMVLRERVLDLLEALVDLRSTVYRLAGEHAETVMPGYTHLQHAQPITFGFYLAAAGDALGRDLERLMSGFERVNRSPLGAAALATSGFPIHRQRTARLLGFSGLLENAYDAVASRDDALEVVCAAAIVLVGLSRLAEDLLRWTTMEFDLVEVDDAHALVSSIMPQKKNPHPLETAKAMAGYVLGDLVACLTTVKNTSFADVSDGVTGVNRPVLQAVEQSTLCVKLLDSVLAALKVKKENMARLARVGYGTMTELADTLVREWGIPFRTAHNMVARVVREALANGLSADAITPEMVVAAAREAAGLEGELDLRAVRRALDPLENVRIRTVEGGPAPEELRRMLADRQRNLADWRSRLGDLRAQMARAAGELEERARSLAG